MNSQKHAVTNWRLFGNDQIHKSHNPQRNDYNSFYTMLITFPNKRFPIIEVPQKQEEDKGRDIKFQDKLNEGQWQQGLKQLPKRRPNLVTIAQEDWYERERERNKQPNLTMARYYTCHHKILEDISKSEFTIWVVLTVFIRERFI